MRVETKRRPCHDKGVSDEQKPQSPSPEAQARPTEAQAIREKLRAEVYPTHAPELIAHHRRGALLILAPDADLLDAAVAIAQDDQPAVKALVDAQKLGKPSLSDLADWSVDAAQQLQVVILQPYVLAQLLPKGEPAKADA